jgi:hypothetical protein
MGFTSTYTEEARKVVKMERERRGKERGRGRT